MIKGLSATEQETLYRYLPATWHEQRRRDDEMLDVDRCVTYLTQLLEAVTAHLPRMISGTESQRPAGSGAFHQVTLLFADVSGFTPMSERFSREEEDRGQGTEELTRVVNSYFEVVNYIAQSYGGDLLKFGGDAVLSLFEGENYAARACRAALEMQTAMVEQFAQVSTSLGVFPLRMNIGLGSGPLFDVRLGTQDRVEVAVLGLAMERMAQSEKLAQAGQTVMDLSTAQAAGPGVVVRLVEGGEGYALLEAAEPVAQSDLSFSISPPVGSPLDVLRWLLASLDRLTPYLPPGLLEKLRPAPTEMGIEADHRWATTFFAGLRGASQLVQDLGEERVAESAWAINRYYVTMRDIVERYEGVVSKVGAGAGGFALHILFGAPVAHEDDPERAVRAALEMQSELDHINQEVAQALALNAPPFQQAIGVTTGLVFAGSVGSSRRREYTLMGDVVNLAHRLMSSVQDGEVSVSAPTASHLSAQIVLEEQTPIQLKGKSEPVQYFLVEGLAEGAALEGAVRQEMVGRAAERERALAALTGVIQGTGKVLSIRGEAGIGKTRLALETVWRARDQGVSVFSGQCVSFLRDTVPYFPWTQVLRSLLRVPAGGTPAEQISALAEGLERMGLAGWEPLVGEILGLPVEETLLTGSLDPRLRQQRFFDIVLELVAKSTRERSLLLWMDNIQWADVASLGLMDYVARNIRGLPALVLVTHRPMERLDTRWKDLPHGVEITLGEMSAEERAAWIAHLLEVDQVPEPVLRGIQARAQGNPLFIEEMVRELIESNVLVHEAAGWVMTAGLEAAGVPDTVQGILQGRLDRLPETERRVLQVASVIGQSFASGLLEGVYPHGDLDGTLPDRLRFLDEQRFVMRAPPPADYAFRHAMTQEVSYGSLLHARRQVLHRSVAHFIEQASGGEIPEQLEFVALHFYRGREWDKAFNYLLQAGRRAQREYANDAAITHFERALRSAAELETVDEAERLTLLESLGEVLTITGRYDEALDHLEVGRALVEDWPLSMERDRQMAELCRQMAAVHEAKGDYEIALEWIKKGLALAGIKDRVEGASLQLRGAAVHYRQGNNELAAEWCQRGLAITDGIPGRAGREVLAHGNRQLGGILVRRGDLDGAIAHCEKSLSLYQELEDLLGQAEAHTNLAIVHYFQDTWDLAAHHHNAAMKIAEQVGYAEGQARAASNLGGVYLVQGRIAEAREQYRIALDIVERLGMTYGVGLMHNNLGEAYARGEQWQEAMDHLAQSLSVFEAIGSDEFLAELFRHYAEVTLGRGKLDAALSYAERSLGYAQEHNMRLEEGMTWRVLGSVHRRREDFEEAETALNRALEIAQEAHKRYEVALTRLELARLQVQRGAGELDRGLAEQAAQTFADLGAQLDLEAVQQLLED